YRLDCSPAMLVQHALPVLFAGKPPALVVCGINYGENVGTSVTPSGTVGAALEAARFGLPALAVSRQTALGQYFKYGELDWSAAAHFTRLFAAKLLEGRLPGDADVLNVNVPDSARLDTPWRLTRVSRQAYFWLDPASPSPAARLGEGVLRIDVDAATLEPDSDIQALSRDRVVSVTPLSLDLTARADRRLLSERLLP
ncbi:MAG: 5'/3'-nucleotidase SurE, partial [Elusimicrobia bacterium]|nr:5'/3'-nucleotidase SurE [Elusimicrobiota bacterium]